jgi:8-oxo-dGTP pyrophosphatase MutT (NUDIX family)
LERNPKNAAERELKEETGIRIAASDFKKAFKLKLGEEEVMFVVAKVNSVAALIPQNFQQPPINNQYDEPFTSLIAVAFDSWDTDANFGAAHHTEWFKDGLTHASANDFLT